MYFDFYKFREAPFNLTPNSKFFYSSAKHVEALSTLIYAINHRKGFVVITGDIGSGKTTVCRALINQLDSETQTALITNTRMSGKDMIMSVLEDFEVDYEPGSKAKLHSQLNDYLIDQLRNNRNVVLIIDEAQNLSPAVLEEVRMLSNLETENEKLIQIIFLGQPELKKKLSLPNLEQLRQRIAVYFHLTPLTEEDTYKYIVHRLHIASDIDHNYFTDEALKMIYQFSKGVPRLINQICDSAFLTGFVHEAKVIDKAILNEVIEESPMLQLSAVDKSKFLEDETGDDDSLDINPPKSIEAFKGSGKNDQNDTNAFKISEKIIAELNHLDEEVKLKQDIKDIPVVNDNIIKDQEGEDGFEDLKPDAIEPEAKPDPEPVPEPEALISEVSEPIDEPAETYANEELVEQEESAPEVIHAKQVEANEVNKFTNQTPMSVSGKIPTLMMILFSVFVMASIILFYEII